MNEIEFITTEMKRFQELLGRKKRTKSSRIEARKIVKNVAATEILNKDSYLSVKLSAIESEISSYFNKAKKHSKDNLWIYTTNVITWVGNWEGK